MGEKLTFSDVESSEIFHSDSVPAIEEGPKWFSLGDLTGVS